MPAINVSWDTTSSTNFNGYSYIFECQRVTVDNIERTLPYSTTIDSGLSSSDKVVCIKCKIRHPYDEQYYVYIYVDYSSDNPITEVVGNHGYVKATYNRNTEQLTVTNLSELSPAYMESYRYSYITSNNFSLRAVGNYPTYNAIIPNVSVQGLNFKLSSLADCFNGCSNLKTAPAIMEKSPNLSRCFKDCTSLEGDIYIWSESLPGVTGANGYEDCFAGTTKDITLRGTESSSNRFILELLEGTTTNNNVYINTAPTTLPSTIECTPMNYQTDNELVQLSPQTDASLVSVQVPNGSGTITTTLEDALVDLYSRTSGLKTTLTSPQTINGITITPLSDGSISLNGTATDSVELKFFRSNKFKAGRYTVSLNNFDWSTLYIVYYRKSNETTMSMPVTMRVSRVYNIAFSFDIPSSSLPPITFYIIIPSGQTYNNEIIKPIIRLVGDA